METEYKKLEDNYNNNNNISNNEEPKYPIIYNYIFFIIFLCIGLINNLGFVLILSSSQQISKQLNNSQLIALFPLSLICFNSLSRIINSIYFIKISYTKRFLCLSFYIFSGYLLLYYILDSIGTHNSLFNFFLTLIPVIILGTASSLGEATILGYLRTFPKEYVSGWGSGTGMAGVVGASLSLIVKKNNWILKDVYYNISLVGILYFILYFISKKLKEFLEEKYNISFERNSDVSINKELNKQNLKIGFCFAKRYLLNLFFIFFFEYLIIIGFCERISRRKFEIFINDFYFRKFIYESFMLCYQIGVFISRSSLSLIKNLTYVEIFPIFQFLNLCFWIFEYYYFLTDNYYLLFCHLIFIGLCAGSCYILSFYLLIGDENIEKEFKELCINIGTIFDDFGIFLASIVVLILDNSLLFIQRK